MSQLKYHHKKQQAIYTLQSTFSFFSKRPTKTSEEKKREKVKRTMSITRNFRLEVNTKRRQDKIGNISKDY